MSAGATALDEAFTQEFAEERQPERVTFRYTQETWELDWEDWWAYRQGELDLENLVTKIRIQIDAASVPARALPTKTEPKAEALGEGLPFIWILVGLGGLVLLAGGLLLWLLTRKKNRRLPRAPEPRPRPAAPPPLPLQCPTLLLFDSGPLAGRAVPLGQGLRLGREQDCHVVLEDTSVSRHHADLVQIPQGWLLRDLGSSNGTHVNGVRIQGEVLLCGDEVLVFGTVRARLSA
jgi:hypothetical protein